MYSSVSTIVLGFHGCDKKVKQAIINGKERLKPSENDYDWLGNGIYFWENNPKRALEYAKMLKEHPERCKSPKRQIDLEQGHSAKGRSGSSS